MKIGSRVYVSFLSGSKVAGEVGTVIGVSTRDGYKIRTDFGVIGYVAVRYASELFTDAPASVDAPSVIDPTDLLTKAVDFNDFLTNTTKAGFVTDQWIEDGVELLNIVHDGDFSVVPRSFVSAVLKRVPMFGYKAYTFDYYI